MSRCQHVGEASSHQHLHRSRERPLLPRRLFLPARRHRRSGSSPTAPAWRRETSCRAASVAQSDRGDCLRFPPRSRAQIPTRRGACSPV